MPFRLRHVHIHALVHDGKVALFDTGMNVPESIQALDEALSTLGKTTKDIDQIFLTHFHADHCGIAGRIQELSGAVVRLSATDEKRLQYNSREEDLAEQARNFYLSQGLPQKAMDTLIKLMAVFREATIPFRVDSHLEPHDRHTLGNKIAGGHRRPGSHGGTDVFLFSRRTNPAGRGSRPSRHHSQSEPRHLPARLPPAPELPSIPRSHPGPSRPDGLPRPRRPFPDLGKRVDEIKEHHAERIWPVLEALKGTGKTAFEVSGNIFGTDLPEFDQFLALNETYVHLVELMDNGFVVAVERDGLVVYHLL